jgi:hypothetical protein
MPSRNANRLKVINARHEQTTAYMALGYAQSTGKPSAFTVVPGPGVMAPCTLFDTCSGRAASQPYALFSVCQGPLTLPIFPTFSGPGVKFERPFVPAIGHFRSPSGVFSPADFLALTECDAASSGHVAE